MSATQPSLAPRFVSRWDLLAEQVAKGGPNGPLTGSTEATCVILRLQWVTG